MAKDLMLSKGSNTLNKYDIMNFQQKVKFKLTPNSVINKRRMLNEYVVFNDWLRNDCQGLPPHVFKQNTIVEFQKKSGIDILVETGTYLGDMVEAQKKFFQKIYSIELSIMLYKKAKKRFKRDANVEIIQGDSGRMLSQIVNQLDRPAIFWLDGHYSGNITAKGDKECPVFEELDAIFNGKIKNHILLIDDARCFVGQGDYPTIDELAKYIAGKNLGYKLEIKKDIICFTI
jgi:hypothetical protein